MVDGLLAGFWAIRTGTIKSLRAFAPVPGLIGTGVNAQFDKLRTEFVTDSNRDRGGGIQIEIDPAHVVAGFSADACGGIIIG